MNRNDTDASTMCKSELLWKDDTYELRRIRPVSDAAKDEPLAHKILEQALDLLEKQWPKSGPYKEKLLSTEDIPCSFLLVSNDECVGHGRLTECFEVSGCRACSATFIIIDERLRGRGLGRKLMELLEHRADGYHFIYLWTHTAQDFYAKLGYSITQRVSLNKSCLKKLKQEQVMQLEDLLRRRNPNARKAETVLLPGSDDILATSDDVWMRKRLVEFEPSKSIAQEVRMEEIKKWFQDNETEEPPDETVRLINLPWQAQIGPSCGLTALRMIRDYYRPDDVMPSLLSIAQSNGFSQDGEIFDIRHLDQLARSACLLNCELRRFSELRFSDIAKVLDTGGTFVLPYDSLPGVYRPTQRSGHSAHYGIIVGLASDHLVIQHSLSERLVVAPYEVWFESNQQLTQVDSARFPQAQIYLSDHVLVIHGPSS